MLTYIVTFAGLSSAVVLAVVYLADRYEREPLESIQDSFLLGAAVQLVPVLILTGSGERCVWSAGWMIATAAAVGTWLPFHLRRIREANERFDGIVYSVAIVAGASCVVHIANLPLLVTGSPFAGALAGEATPSLRDLSIVVGWPELNHELARHVGLVAAAILAGAISGTGRAARWPVAGTALSSGAVAGATATLVWLFDPGWWMPCLLLVGAAGWAAAIKRRSVFRDAPVPPESEILARAVRTLLLVLGTALAAAVMLQAVGGSANVRDLDPSGTPVTEVQS